MTISADEIESKAFVVSLRGYDRVEVDRWLRDLAEEHRKLVAELQAATAVDDGVVDLREPIDAFTVVGREVAEVLRAAREAAAAMFDRAAEEIEAHKQKMLAELDEERASRARAIDRVRAALVDDLLRDRDEP